MIAVGLEKRYDAQGEKEIYDMKRILIGLFVTMIVAVAGCKSESGGFTPPIATPNQNLPLYEAVSQDATGGGDVVADEWTPSTEDTKVLITAEPDIIHRYAYGSNYNSKITVENDVFEPESTVTVWGVVADTEDITSPPWIYEADLDTSTEKVQLKANENGGLEFWIMAGNSTGEFTIKVSGANGTTLSVTITITE